MAQRGATSEETARLLTVQLTKLETALDQVRKSYPDLLPTDAAMIAGAVSLTGRHALAVHGGEDYVWPDDYERLAKAMVGQVKAIQESVDAAPAKKTAKATGEEEPVTVIVELKPNFEAGETVLLERDDLKALLGQILSEGVEYVYANGDLGWQWALDRVNWQTLSGHEITRRIKVRVEFGGGATGVETGGPAKKKVAVKKAEIVEIPSED